MPCATTSTRGCAPTAGSSWCAAPGFRAAGRLALEGSIPEGPALLGFMAARAAEEISGVDGYYAERARQSAWLLEHLA